MKIRTAADVACDLVFEGRLTVVYDGTDDRELGSLAPEEIVVVDNETGVVYQGHMAAGTGYLASEVVELLGLDE